MYFKFCSSERLNLHHFKSFVSENSDTGLTGPDPGLGGSIMINGFGPSEDLKPVAATTFTLESSVTGTDLGDADGT